MSQWSQTQNQVRDDWYETLITTQRYLQMHVRSGQPDLLEDGVQSETHFWVRARTYKRLVDRTKRTRPKRQAVTEGKHRNPRRFLERQHSTRPNQAGHGPQHGN